MKEMRKPECPEKTPDDELQKGTLCYLMRARTGRPRVSIL